MTDALVLDQQLREMAVVHPAGPGELDDGCPDGLGQPR